MLRRCALYERQKHFPECYVSCAKAQSGFTTLGAARHAGHSAGIGVAPISHDNTAVVEQATMHAGIEVFNCSWLHSPHGAQRSRIMGGPLAIVVKRQ